MVENEQIGGIIQARLNNVLIWLRNPYNLSIVLVLLFALAIRLYYFWLTRSQPLWWDELCYGSLAKNFISHAWDGTPLIIGELHIRPLLYSYIWSFLLLLQLPEVATRFILGVIPSIISIVFVYLIGKEIYNKKVGIVSSAIFSVFWLGLFYSSRFLVHMLEIAFLASSIYFFILYLKNDQKLKYFLISLILLSLATLTRYQDGMVFFIYFILLLLTKKLYLNKIKFWVYGIAGFIPVLLFFLTNFLVQGNIFPALLAGDYVGKENTLPFAFNTLNFIPTFLTLPFLMVFLVGLGVLLFNLLLGYNFIKENDELRGSLFMILILIVFFSFFIFYIKSIEDRWLFETLIPLSLFAGFGLVYLSDIIKKYWKPAAVIFIILILALGCYYQLKLADPLIKNKKESYLQIRQAFEWIKDNTPESSVVVGAGIEPYAVYYAERQYLRLPENYSDISQVKGADYLVVHGFSPQPSYINDYVSNKTSPLQVVNAFFLDEKKTQPIAIVYKIIK